MPAGSVQKHTTHFYGIGVVALAVIAFQVLLTRLFSAICFYHFAFVGISLAMLGLTIGAQHVYANKQRFSPAHMEAEWVKAAIKFALSLAICTLCFLYLPLLWPSLTVVYMCFFAIPFAYSGICVALILTKSSASVGKLYAADLAGASIGCFAIVIVLFYLDPVTIVFGLAFVVCLMAWMMARQANLNQHASRFVALFFLAGFLLHGGLYFMDAPHLRVVWAKGQYLEKALFERWNTFSLVRVSPGEKNVFGWGFGHAHGAGPQQLSLWIDAQAGTAITAFDGKDLEPFSYLANDIINSGYALHPIDSVAVIGVGGGRDILSALYFKAREITGIELNPSIFEALTQRFGDFSGHLDKRPEVKLVNAEARSWLDQGRSSFDLIQISLIDTWATTAAGGLSMSENKLYTVDAWKDFLTHTKPQGFLSISRWYEPQKHSGELYRLLSIATKTLQQRGVAANDIDKHILVFIVSGRLADTDAGIVTMILSPDALSAETIATAHRHATDNGFQLLIAPGRTMDSISSTILAGKADDAFYDMQPVDFSPSTDDRPFFFHMARLKDIVQGHGVQDDMKDANEANFAVMLVCALLIFTFCSTLYFMFVPLAETWKQIDDKRGTISHMAYFAAIGLGFMLIEVSQMQRLMIFLGHPVYALTVVLFTLLLFGGIGSFAIDAITRKTRYTSNWLAPAALITVLAITGLATPWCSETLKIHGTPVRVMVSVVLLAPAAFFMGMMFPLGMMASARYRALQPWFWSINGATSVLGSVLGVVISMEIGISAAFWAGVAFYLFCLFLPRNAQPARH